MENLIPRFPKAITEKNIPKPKQHFLTAFGIGREYVKTVKAEGGKAEMLGYGSSGVVMQLTVTPSIRKLWTEHLKTKTPRKFVSMPRLGKTIALKILVPSTRVAIINATRELYIHAMLANSSCKTIGRLRLCARNVVPKLYWGAFDGLVFFIAMDVAPGRPVSSYASLTEAQYDAIERAFMALWANNVLHNDGHMNNLFITPSGKVTILDFGMAMYAKPLSGIKTMMTSWPQTRAVAMTLSPLEQRAVKETMQTRMLKFTGLLNTTALKKITNRLKT